MITFRSSATPPSPRSRPARRWRSSRGAIAVETAICGSLLVMMFFGALEMGLLMQSRARLTDASRDGVRTAAALSRVDGYQNNAVAAIRGIYDASSIDWITIYKADPTTGLPAGGQPLEACFTNCWMYSHDAMLGLVQVSGASWPASTQVACGSLTANDWIGVYIRSHHDWMTGILPGSRTLTDHVVMRIEPLELGVQCR